MSRGAELFDYINQRYEPTNTDERYFSLSITPELKKFRKEYQKNLTKKNKNGLIEEEDGTYSLW